MVLAPQPGPDNYPQPFRFGGGVPARRYPIVRGAEFPPGWGSCRPRRQWGWNRTMKRTAASPAPSVSPAPVSFAETLSAALAAPPAACLHCGKVGSATVDFGGGWWCPPCFKELDWEFARWQDKINREQAA